MELYHPETPGSNTSVLLCWLTPSLRGNCFPMQQLISKEKSLIKPLNKVVWLSKLLQNFENQALDFCPRIKHKAVTSFIKIKNVKVYSIISFLISPLLLLWVKPQLGSISCKGSISFAKVKGITLKQMGMLVLWGEKKGHTWIALNTSKTKLKNCLSIMTCLISGQNWDFYDQCIALLMNFCCYIAPPATNLTFQNLSDFH